MVKIIQNTLCDTIHCSFHTDAFLPTQRASLRPELFSALATTAERFKLSQGRPLYSHLSDSTSATGVM